jgi:hypothetical protein
MHTWNESSTQNRTFLHQHQKPAVGQPGTADLTARYCMARDQTAPTHGQTARSARADPKQPLDLIFSMFLFTPSFAPPQKTHLLPFSLKVKRTLLVGRPCPLIPVQPRASPVSPRHPPPSPPGISSIPFLFTHVFRSLGFNVSSMRIQFWVMDLLD